MSKTIPTIALAGALVLAGCVTDGITVTSGGINIPLPAALQSAIQRGCNYYVAYESVLKLLASYTKNGTLGQSIEAIAAQVCAAETSAPKFAFGGTTGVVIVNGVRVRGHFGRS